MSQQLKAARKIYCTDNGFVMAKAFRFSPDIGRLMKNAVAVELVRRGYKINEKLFYYKTKTGKEIDFVVREGLHVVRLIQVCYETKARHTLNRELAPFAEAGKELGCDDFLLITWNDESEYSLKNIEIKALPLWKWLLQ